MFVCVYLYVCLNKFVQRVRMCIVFMCVCLECFISFPVFFNSVKDVVRRGSVCWTRQAAPTSVHKVKYIRAEIPACVWMPAEQMLQQSFWHSHRNIFCVR